MKMKSIYLSFLALVAFSFFPGDALQAQDPGRERLAQLRIAFLTEKLDLSVEDGQAFWPLYNEFEDEKRTLEREIRRLHRQISERSESINEQDLLKEMTVITEKKKRVAELENSFIQSCSEAIGARKAARLIAAEEEFKREVLKKLKERRPPGPGRR